MKLSVKERLHLVGLLPEEGDVSTLRIVRDLRGALSLSEEEHQRFHVRNEGEYMVWDHDEMIENPETKEREPRFVTNPDTGKTERVPLCQEAEVAVGTKAHAIIVEALNRLNTRKQLKDIHVPLFEKFVEAEAVVVEKEATPAEAPAAT